MDEVAISDAVARLLAWVWPQHREPAFLDYLSATFSEVVTDVPRFEKVCLVEAEEGDAEGGAIGSIVKRWWLADEDGCRAVAFRELPRFADDFNDAQGTDRLFYRFPVVKFLRQGTAVAFGEAFGPRLNCRKVGRLRQEGGHASLVGVRLVWNVWSIGNGYHQLPPHMSPALDIDEAGWFRTNCHT